MKVLIMDDNAEFASYLSDILKDEGLDVVTSLNFDLDDIEKSSPDAVILDCILPQKSGLDILKELRLDVRYQDVPVLMVSGLQSTDFISKALDLGADDFITKPLEPTIFVKKVRAVSRRYGLVAQSKPIFTIGNLTFNDQLEEVLLAGQNLEVTHTEFQILRTLVQSEGGLITRKELLSKVFHGVHVSSRTIDVHICSLRKKLSPSKKRIETIRGRGYKFCA